MIAYGTGGKAKRKTEAEANENSFVVFPPNKLFIHVAPVAVVVAVVVVVRSAYERGNLLTHIYTISASGKTLPPSLSHSHKAIMLRCV